MEGREKEGRADISDIEPHNTVKMYIVVGGEAEGRCISSSHFFSTVMEKCHFI